LLRIAGKIEQTFDALKAGLRNRRNPGLSVTSAYGCDIRRDAKYPLMPSQAKLRS
jgi:hypothetical protein